MTNMVWKIGEVRITGVLDSENKLPVQMLFPIATTEVLAPHFSWLMPDFLDGKGMFTLAMHTFAIEASGKRILVDTGWGDQRPPGHEQPAGSRTFMDDLAKAGFPRESVDLVLCTHCHVDHVGRHTMKSGSQWIPTFPNARYLFVREEVAYWTGLTNRLIAENFSEAVEPLIMAGRADLVDANHKVTEEIRLEPTPGHTPGHVSVFIESGGNQAIILGDASHHPVQWAEPDWSVPVDSDGALAALTRRRLLDRYVNKPVLIIGTHYAFPCAGYLVSEGAVTKFQPEMPWKLGE